MLRALLLAGLLGGVAASRAVHAGHRPAYVQRLTRFDHAGPESFLQAEAAWDPMVLAPVVGHEQASNLKNMQTAFLQMQEAGAAAHQQALDSVLDAEGQAKLKKVQEKMVQDAQVRMKELQAIQQEMKENWEKGMKQVQENMAAGLQASLGGLGMQFAEKITKLPFFPGSEYRNAKRKFGTMSAAQFKSLQNYHEAEHVNLNGTDVILNSADADVQEALKSRVQYNYRKPDYAVTGMSNLFNSQYVGPIGVGTVKSPDNCELPKDHVMFIAGLDAQATEEERKTCHLKEESQIWVVFDTGSTNIWIASDLCTTEPCTGTGRKKFNHGRSATFLEPTSPTHLDITFGTGELKGPQGIDDIHVGPFTVKKQTFGMIQEEIGGVFQEVPFEGILGLAFPAMSANGVTPFFDNVINQKVMGKNEFAFYFNNDDKSGNGIFWGGVDPSFYEGEIRMFNVAQPYYWAIALEKFMIGDVEIQFGNPMQNALQKGLSDTRNPIASMLRPMLKQTVIKQPKLLVDSGTTYFTAETNMYSRIMSYLPTTECSRVTEKSHPPLKFFMLDADGVEQSFVIPSEEYMVSDEDGEMCEPAFMKIDIPEKYGPGMILGEVFMRNYFTVFDRGNGDPSQARVGFARAKKGDHVDKQLKLLTKGQETFKSGHPGVVMLQTQTEDAANVQAKRFHHRPGLNEGSSQLQLQDKSRFHRNPFWKSRKAEKLAA